MTSLSKVLFIFTFLLGGTAMAADMLPGSAWAPTELEGESFEPVEEVFLQFNNDGKYFGRGGCNSIRGQYVTNDDAILLSPAAATMMACPEDVMAQEFAFVQALMTVRQFERVGADLTLTNAAGEVVLRMAERQPG